MIGHPLQKDLTSLSDQEIENKLIELTKRYYQCMKLAPSAVNQVLLMMDDYRNEQQRRTLKKNEQSETDSDLNDLIKID